MGSRALCMVWQRGTASGLALLVHRLPRLLDALDHVVWDRFVDAQGPSVDDRLAVDGLAYFHGALQLLRNLGRHRVAFARRQRDHVSDGIGLAVVARTIWAPLAMLLADPTSHRVSRRFSYVACVVRTAAS